MKNAFLIISAVLIFVQNVFCQKELMTVKAGDEIRQSVPDSIEYLYPQFVSGLVYFKDGKISRAPLNYNLLLAEMHFLSGSDTLALADENTIKLITVNNDSFYYDKNYLQQIKGDASVKLAKKESIKIADVQKISAYDQPSSTSSMNTINNIYSSAGQVYHLNQRQNLVLVKQTSYYIGDAYNHFLPASKKTLVKMFGSRQNEIETFLNENKIAFNKQEDLEKLVSFLQGISK